MGYILHAVIGRTKLIERHSGDYCFSFVAPLSCDQALIPLTEELFEEIGTQGNSDRFMRLTPAVEEWVRAVSATGPVAYVEADFFGGIGVQNSVAYIRGRELLEPTHDPQAINIALRLLGITPGLFADEFSAVGLGRHRHTEDWARDAIPSWQVAW